MDGTSSTCLVSRCFRLLMTYMCLYLVSSIDDINEGGASLPSIHNGLKVTHLVRYRDGIPYIHVQTPAFATKLKGKFLFRF